MLTYMQQHCVYSIMNVTNTRVCNMIKLSKIFINGITRKMFTKYHEISPGSTKIHSLGVNVLYDNNNEYIFCFVRCTEHGKSTR